MSPATATTEQLAALIAAKQHVLEILVKLSRKQLELIAASDITSLLKLLAGKQTVMTQLQSLESQLAPFRHDDPERRTWRSPAERVACQTRADRCNQLLAEAMQLEEQAEETMTMRRESAAAALTGMQTASDARSAYASMPSSMLASLTVEG